MMFVLRLRRASKIHGCALILLACVATSEAGVFRPPQIVITGTSGSSEAQSALTAWLHEDEGWLLSLPPAAVKMGAASVDSLPWMLHQLAGATPDSALALPTVRPLALRLRDRWLDRGFLGATVQSLSDTLLVTMGPRWTIGRWDLGGRDFAGRTRLLETWLPPEGDVYQHAIMQTAVNRVLAGTGENGFPFARWVTQGVDLDWAAHEVTIRAFLYPGGRSWLGPVTSSLARRRARDFLARASGLHRGDRFQHSDLARAGERLRARGLYTHVGTPEVYLTSAVDTVGVFFPVTAQERANRLQVILGVSRRQEGATRLSGEVDLRLPNMAGTGRNLRVGWQDDGVARRHFGFEYLEPLVWRTGLDMGMSLDSEVVQDLYNRFRLDQTWSLPVVAKWGIRLGFGWDRTVYPVGSVERTVRWRTSGAVRHRRHDLTRSGWRGLFSTETAWRSSYARAATGDAGSSELPVGQASTQRIYRIDVAGEWWTGRAMSVFARASARQVTGGEKAVPLPEQFTFGGAATLRGYREDEFHGSDAAWGALELRIGRPMGSRLYTFYDLGYFQFWREAPGVQVPGLVRRQRGFPRGFGLGLLTRTRGGDLSLAVGFPGTVNFDVAKLHVTLMESF